MPLARFTTTVTTEGNDSTAQQHVANCSKYLAYADQTDTFGYHGHVWHTTYEGEKVTFKWKAPVVSNKELNKIHEEMEHLARVEYHTCTSNQGLMSH
jgi:hypothetical protein